mgnify:CR=1 FL=1
MAVVALATGVSAGTRFGVHPSIFSCMPMYDIASAPCVAAAWVVRLTHNCRSLQALPNKVYAHALNTPTCPTCSQMAARGWCSDAITVTPWRLLPPPTPPPPLPCPPAASAATCPTTTAAAKLSRPLVGSSSSNTRGRDIKPARHASAQNLLKKPTSKHSPYARIPPVP